MAPAPAACAPRAESPPGPCDATVRSRAEVAVATADIVCKLRTNLLGVNFAVEAEYENAAIAAHLQELAEVRTHKAAGTERLPDLMRRYDRAPRPL
ncbi:hypothetical protein OG520_18510 [Streptomyces sp. NBC_00984]|uniref:hypothetical protein n=1 Tax=Streptomyces sp. NBC_00984 TaxID=2903700 RepID=UPI00386D2B30|nr:hypothetical protein OG520_18510 [Streptomyces sp. NBC_00984]